MWLPEDRDERAVRRAQRTSRATLGAAGGLFIASLGLTFSDFGVQREPIDVAIGVVRPVTLVDSPHSPDSVASAVSPQVASSPPTLPCVSWQFGAGRARRLVVSGSPCIDLAVLDAGTPVVSIRLASWPGGIGPVVDPVLQTTSSLVPGQIYARTVVMLEREPLSGVVSVVAQSLGTFEPVWTQTCPAPTLVPAVHFSGGDIAQDVAANRADIAVYGVTDYVAVGCDGVGPVLYDPITGAAL